MYRFFSSSSIAIFVSLFYFGSPVPIDIECDEIRISSSYAGPTCTFKDLNNENDTIDYNFYSRSVRDPYTYTYRTNLVTIKSIEFRSSVLPSVPRKIFEKFEKLETLSMVNCQVLEIPRFTFEHATYLVNLDMARNNITKLEKNSFSGTHVLSKIDLSRNLIETIDPKAFNELANIKHLFLSANKITTLDAEVFKFLKNLAIIKLDNNQLSTIPSNIFLGNQQIQEIDLNGNLLNALKLSFFDNMPNILSYIDVSYNSLKLLFIDCTTFSYTYDEPNPLYVNVSNNLLTSIDISPNFTVTHLFAGGNNISDLTIISKYTKLKTLDLSNNHVGQLNLTTFSNLPLLTYLNLEATSISGIDYGTFSHQTNLITLDISYNQLMSLDISMFASVTELQALYIDGNNLTSIDYIQLIDTFPKINLVGLQDNDFNCTALAKVISELGRRSIRIDVVEETRVMDKPNIKGIACVKDGEKPIWHNPIYHIHNNTDVSVQLVETVNHIVSVIHGFNVSLQQSLKTKDDLQQIRDQLRQLTFDFYQMKSEVTSNQLAAFMNATTTTDTRDFKNMVDIMNNITLDRQKLELDKIKHIVYDLETKIQIGQEKIDDMALRPQAEKRKEVADAASDNFTKIMITIIFVALIVFGVIKMAMYLRYNERFSYSFRPRTNTQNTLHSTIEHSI